MKATDLGLTPTEGKIIVRPEEEKDTLASGIILPENREQKRKRTAEVVVVDAYNTYELKIGDRIIFEEYGAHKINHSGEELLIIDTFNTEVLAILPKKSKVDVGEDVYEQE